MLVNYQRVPSPCALDTLMSHHARRLGTVYGGDSDRGMFRLVTPLQLQPELCWSQCATRTESENQS